MGTRKREQAPSASVGLGRDKSSKLQAPAAAGKLPSSRALRRDKMARRDGETRRRDGRNAEILSADERRWRWIAWHRETTPRLSNNIPRWLKKKRLSGIEIGPFLLLPATIPSRPAQCPIRA